MRNENIWIPDRQGVWHDSEKTTIDLLLRYAAPYSSSDDDVHAAGGGGGTAEATDPSAIWIAVEEVADVLMVSGLKSADAETAKSLSCFAHMLPGMSGGRLSFQELLTVYSDVASGERSASPIGQPHGGASGATSGGRIVPERHSLKSDQSERSEASSDLPRQRTRGSDVPIKKHATLPSNMGRPTAWAPIEREFRDLDIMNDGRLTYMSMKSSLEIRDEHVADDSIRQWIRSNDRGSKGFVDLQDFMRATSFVGSNSSMLLTDRTQPVRQNSKFQEKDKIKVLKR